MTRQVSGWPSAHFGWIRTLSKFIYKYRYHYSTTTTASSTTTTIINVGALNTPE